MENSPTALFLLTGLITACGSRPEPKDKQERETEAMMAALSISRHYPGTSFSSSADTYIEIMQKNYLEKDG